MPEINTKKVINDRIKSLEEMIKTYTQELNNLKHLDRCNFINDPLFLEAQKLFKDTNKTLNNCKLSDWTITTGNFKIKFSIDFDMYQLQRCYEGEFLSGTEAKNIQKYIPTFYIKEVYNLDKSDMFSELVSKCFDYDSDINNSKTKITMIKNNQFPERILNAAKSLQRIHKIVLSLQQDYNNYNLNLIISEISC